MASAPSPFLRCETRMRAVQLCAETGTELTVPGLHPHFKGSAYHSAELCPSSLLLMPLWKVLPADPRASGEQPHLDGGREGGRGGTSLCLLVLKGYCRMCKAKLIPRSSHLCCCCHTTSLTEGILQRISLCAPQFSTGIYTSDMNLLTQKFTRCVNRFRDH